MSSWFGYRNRTRRRHRAGMITAINSPPSKTQTTAASPKRRRLSDDLVLLSGVARAVYLARLLCPFPMATTKYATMLPKRRKGAASKVIPTQAFIRSLARISRSAARCHRRVIESTAIQPRNASFEVTNVNSRAVPATMRIDR